MIYRCTKCTATRYYYGALLIFSIVYLQKSCCYLNLISLHSTFEQRDRLVTIPNILSMTRIVLSPYLSYLLLQEHFVGALMLFTAAGLTDWVNYIKWI